jgi:hypothetical protein
MSATGAKASLFMGRTYTSSFFEEAEESSAYDSIYYVLDGWRMTSGHSLRLALLLVLLCSGIAQAQTKTIGKTQIVLLGTGTPLPDPERSGPCTAIIVNGIPYLVDFGTGLVRRAAAARNKGVDALEPANLKPVSSPTCTLITRSDLPTSSLRHGSWGEKSLWRFTVRPERRRWPIIS